MAKTNKPKKNRKPVIRSPRYTKKDSRLPELPLEVPKKFKAEGRILTKGSALVSANSNHTKQMHHREASSWTAQVITNIPYTPQDYLYFEDAWSWTLAGLAVDKKMDFVIGRGINPTIEILDKKDMNEEQLTQLAEKFNYIVDALKKVDQTPAINLKQTVYDAARMAKVFGRAVLAFEYGTQSNIGIPVAVKIIHPRDLGRVQVNELDWSIESVINYMGMAVGESNFIAAEDMIYFVNQPNNPMRRNLFYGHSEMQRVIGVARAMRRVLEYDIPEIVEAMWAGYGLFLVDPEGKQPSDVQAELGTLLNNLSPGTFGAVSGKPNEKIQFIPLNLQPNVAGIVSLIDVFERLLIGNQGVPAALLGREEDSNMATLFGKIRLFLAGPVAQDREWLGNILDNQWYNPLLKKLFPNEAKTIRIKTEFEPIITESWIDNIDALQKLSITIPQLPQEKLLELVGLDSYKNDLEPDQATIERIYKDYPPSPDQVKGMANTINNRPVKVPIKPQGAKSASRYTPVVSQDEGGKEKLIATMGDVEAWWNMGNYSMRQHYIDPNDWNPEATYEYAKNDFSDLTPEQKEMVIRGFQFRNENFDVCKLLGIKLDKNDPDYDVKQWWDVLVPSMRQHMVDPGKNLTAWSTDISRLDYDQMDSKQKEAVFRIYKFRNTERKKALLDKLDPVPTDIKDVKSKQPIK